MPTLQQAQQLKEFAEEVFELSKDVWAAQSRTKAKEPELDITEIEFLALDLLAREGRLSVGKIQRNIGVLPAQMSRVIRSLESKETPLIACQINPQDKRKIDVELTASGRKAHETYRKIKLGSTEKLLLCLSEHDRAEFMRILRIFRDEMHKAVSEKEL